MIGVFDSGVGGLTVLRALVDRFPGESFVYLGDHANVPYGNRTSAEILALTQHGVERLFSAGCRLVLLGCNTATATAARHLQQVWLEASGWRARGHNVLGIIAPTVEVATQTPWAVTTPQYPQKFNASTIAVFATRSTVTSNVFTEEIQKRCPRVTVIEIACPGLAGAIEDRAGSEELSAMVDAACSEAHARASNAARAIDWAVLGCTHFPIVEQLFRERLPGATRILSQPGAVADSLEDYLARHPRFANAGTEPHLRLTTTGDPAEVDARAGIFWPGAPRFEQASVTRAP